MSEDTGNPKHKHSLAANLQQFELKHLHMEINEAAIRALGLEVEPSHSSTILPMPAISQPFAAAAVHSSTPKIVGQEWIIPVEQLAEAWVKTGFPLQGKGWA